MSTPPLSFDRASYAGDPAGPDRCAYCQSEIAGEYYRVSGNLACNVCAQKAQSLIPPNSHGAFARALSYGAAAAIAGCIGYALLTITTGWTIGYAAIGVGWIVGWAMKRGAKGNGGRRYQWAAALLTYAAVAVAFVPIMLHSIKERPVHRAAATQSADTVTGDGPVLQQPAQAPPHKTTVSFAILQSRRTFFAGTCVPVPDALQFVRIGCAELIHHLHRRAVCLAGDDATARRGRRAVPGGLIERAQVGVDFQL